MRRFILLFVLIMASLSVSAQVKRTIHVETAGTLPDLISEDEKYQIEELTLSGELNGTDIHLIRDMAGINTRVEYWGYHSGRFIDYTTDGKLSLLDISKAKIVSGGSAYYTTGSFDYEEDAPRETLYYTEDNSISTNMFHGCASLTSVTIPNSVTSIGYRAFYGTAWYNNQPDGILYLDICLLGYKGDTKPSGVIEIKEGTRLIAGHAFQGCSGLTSITIPNSVTSIGDYAFSACSGLTSITIPNSVTSIGEYAFESCSGLNSVTIGNSVTSIDDYAFSGCSGLTSIVSQISNPFEINENVFPSSIYSTATLSVPFGTKSVYEATNGWKNFKNIVEAPSTKRTIHVATAGTLPDLISEEEKYQIEELTLTGELNGTDIHLIRDMAGIDMDKMCDGLSSEYMPTVNSQTKTHGQLKYLDLSEVNIVEGGRDYYRMMVVSVGEHFGHHQYTKANSISHCMFAGCWKLESLILPRSVSSISSPFHDSFAVEGMTYSLNIKNLKVAEGNPYYDSRNDCNAIIETKTNTLILGCQTTVIPNDIKAIGDNAFWGGKSPFSVIIPKGVTSIGNYAFRNCSGLTSITLPNTVTSIGSYAFRNCNGLTFVHISDIKTWCGIVFNGNDSNPLNYAHHLYLNGEEIKELTIPSDITSIANYAFYWCSGLNSVTIGNSVTSIGDEAFYNCSGLAKVFSKIENPFAITSNVFYNIPSDAELFVPQGTKSLYESTEGWDRFQNVKEIMEGDVNFDEKVNTNDKDALVSYILGESADNVECMYDVNGDGKVDVADVVALVALIDSKSSQGLSTDSQIYFDEVDGSQVVSSLICTLNNERDEDIVLTKCELYCNQKMVSYKNYSASSGSLAAGGFKSCSFDNLTKFNSKSGFSVRWHYTSNGEAYVYRCTLTE